MDTNNNSLPVVRPEGWEVPEVFAGVTTFSEMRTTVEANDADVDKYRTLADVIERDNAYGVASLGLSIVTAISDGMTPAEVAVTVGYAEGARAGEMFVGRYRVIGEAVSHGCDVDTVLALRTFVREGITQARNAVKAATTDDGIDNDKLTRAIVKAGKPTTTPPTEAEALSKRLVSAHKAMLKVAESIANGTPLSDTDRQNLADLREVVGAL